VRRFAEGLDPAARAILEGHEDIWHDVDGLTVERARQPRGSGAPAARRSAAITVRDVTIPGPGGPLRARVWAPRDASSTGLLVWFRGGGFVLGTLDDDPELLDALTLASGATVVSVEYRLAPEHPFPAAPEDAYAALLWIAEHREQLCGREVSIAVAGESAGGNLAAVVAQLSRDRGGPELALQALLYPMTAWDYDGPSKRSAETEAMASAGAMQWLQDKYLPAGDVKDPCASPLHAPSLRGLAPALVITAEYDVLRDEGEAYAQRLVADGVAVSQRRYLGMPHGFASWIGQVDAAAACAQQVGHAVRAALQPAVVS
jgi:acetyl esterase/lipase